MSELKACPFCSSSKIREFNSLFPGIGECQNCVAVSSKWQSRPIEDALRAENEKLRDAIDMACGHLCNALGEWQSVDILYVPDPERDAKLALNVLEEVLK